MANRSSASRRIPGNPLGSILRETQRAARSTTRRSVGVPGPKGAAGQDGEEGPQGAAGQGSAAAGAVVTTDAAGAATFTFPAPFAGVPVVVATPVSTIPIIVTISSVTSTSVTLNAFTVAGAANPNRSIHVAAFGP